MNSETANLNLDECKLSTTNGWNYACQYELCHSWIGNGV